MIKDLNYSTLKDVLTANRDLSLIDFDKLSLSIMTHNHYFNRLFQKYGKMYVIMEDQQIDEDYNLADVTTESKAYPATALLHEAVGKGNDFKTTCEKMVSAYSDVIVDISDYGDPDVTEMSVGMALYTVLKALGTWDLINALQSLEL